MSKVLSIFCDESGDFGKYSKFSSYYIVGFVFHDQNISIKEPIRELEYKLQNLDYSNDEAIHSFPIIRGENQYKTLTYKTRMKLLSAISSFYRHCNVKSTSIVIDKKIMCKKQPLSSCLETKINDLFRDKSSYFRNFDKIIVYYDSGQKKLTKILKKCFTENFNNVVFRIIEPKDYYLFQVSDLVCTLELLKTKYPDLTKSEK